jgi:hypothetical protein
MVREGWKKTGVEISLLLQEMVSGVASWNGYILTSGLRKNKLG